MNKKSKRLDHFMLFRIDTDTRTKFKIALARAGMSCQQVFTDCVREFIKLHIAEIRRK